MTEYFLEDFAHSGAFFFGFIFNLVFGFTFNLGGFLRRLVWNTILQTQHDCYYPEIRAAIEELNVFGVEEKGRSG